MVSFSLFQFPTPALGNTFYAGDINGDGKTDIVGIKQFQYLDENDNLITEERVATYFSKGDGTFEFVSQTLPGTISVDVFLWVGDYNGDGKFDFFATDTVDVGSIFTFFSKGDGSYNVLTQPVEYVNDIFQSWQGDFQGTAKNSVVAFSGAIRTQVYPGAYPDLLTNIVNPFGGQNAITYKPLTDPTVYAKDTGGLAAVYPNKDLQETLYVVSTMTVTDGVGNNYNNTYTYGGAKGHVLGRGSLGFRWMTEVDVTANRKKTTFFKQNFPLTGLPDTVEIDRNSDGAGFLDTVNTYLTGNAYLSAPTVSFVAPSQQDTIQMDGTGSSRTIRKTMEYDSFANGNPTRTYHHGDITVSGDERDERTDWIVDAANWLHRPKRQALYDGNGVLVREKWLYYDNQAHGSLGGAGLLTKEESNAGSGIGNVNNPTVSYGYDPSFGVKTSTTDARGCTTTTAYESTKTFPQTVTNCLTHQATMVYDARFGVMTSQTDENGQTTTSAYDSFGRLSKVTGPLDSASTYGTISKFYMD